MNVFDEYLEERRLMPKENPHGHHDWVSRDYARLDCGATGCWFNDNGQCAVPSLCKIGEDGRCVSFTPKPVQKTYEGD